MSGTRRSRGSLEADVRELLAAAAQPMTPGQVRDALGGDLAYTTVMTVLSRLHDKGEVVRRPAGRGYAYSAHQDPSEITAHRMRQLLDADADRAGVLARFVGRLEPGDEALLRTLLSGAESAAPRSPGHPAD